MHQTLEDLEIQLEYEKMRKPKHSFKKFFGEMKVLVVIFAVVFLWMYLVTNAQLIVDNFQDRFSPTEVQVLKAEEVHRSADLLVERQEKQQKVEELVEKYSEVISVEKEIAPSMDQLLRADLKKYDFDFNVLPPTNRLVIPAINLDVPLVQTAMKEYADFTAGSFDTELENWVVKYPTTPNPGEWGNAFFFWHTSSEYRKHNKYGTVFRNIPKLKENDVIQVIWEGVLYEYKVVKTVIVKPKEVNDAYVEYVDVGKEYITLMGCYPIGRTDKRMMIFAERI